MGSRICAAMLAQMAIAFSPPVHAEITRTAMSTSGLPADALRYLSALPRAVVAVDVDRANIPDHGDLGDFTQDGQKHHFMLKKGLKQKEALKECLDWIKTNSREGVTRIMNWPWARPKRVRGAGDGFGTSHDDFTFEKNATRVLASALHAVQDSFSVAHVHRTDQEVITRIFAWDKENQDPGPDAGKAGAVEWDEARNCPGPGWKGHKVYDDVWKADLQQVDYTKPHVSTAVEASAALLSLTFRAAMFSKGNPEKSFDELMTVFVGKYFVADLKD